MRLEMAVGGLRYGAEAGDEVGYDFRRGGRDAGERCRLRRTPSRAAGMVIPRDLISLISLGEVKVVTSWDRGHVVVVGRGAESEIHCRRARPDYSGGNRVGG